MIIGVASSSKSLSATISNRPEPEPATPEGRQRKADLPHRSLPRQRNRPEHHGVPLRQRNLRAHLEPPLHRSRADYRSRKRSESKSAAAITIQAGALRDMVPNHIMQLISLTAMEPPISFQADAVRDEQPKILHAIQPFLEEVLSRPCAANTARAR